MEKEKYYDFDKEDGTPIFLKISEMNWILRYGSAEDIMANRFYIAHILSLYEEIQQKKINKKKGR